MCERFEGRVLLSQDMCGIRAGVNFASEYGCDQVGALRKVAINGANADTSLFCDLAHRSVYSRRREHRLGCLQQSVDAALCVGTHLSAGAIAWLRIISSVAFFGAHRIAS